VKPQHRVARLAAFAWVSGALAAATPAAATDSLGWDSLRPAAAPAGNPFERLTTQQADWIAAIAQDQLMQARGGPVSAGAAARQAALAAVLAAEGLDAEALLRQRDAVIAQRRTAAQAPVPAVSGREARLIGCQVPASADGSTTTDWLFVPWAATCSHPALPANQIVRIPAQDLVDADRHGSQPLVLTGRIGVREQESRLGLADGELPFALGLGHRRSEAGCPAHPRPLSDTRWSTLTMTLNLVWACATFALMAAVSAAVAQPADPIWSGGPISL
jgi:hypothetical protein